MCKFITDIFSFIYKATPKTINVANEGIKMVSEMTPKVTHALSKGLDELDATLTSVSKSLAIKNAATHVFPYEKDIKPKSREEVLSELIKKYGDVDVKQFDLYLQEHRNWMIGFIEKSEKKDAKDLQNIRLLNNIELHKLFIKRKEELKEELEAIKKLFR